MPRILPAGCLLAALLVIHPFALADDGADSTAFRALLDAHWANQQREKMCDHGLWEETGAKYDAEGTGP